MMFEGWVLCCSLRYSGTAVAAKHIPWLSESTVHPFSGSGRGHTFTSLAFMPKRNGEKGQTRTNEFYVFYQHDGLKAAVLLEKAGIVCTAALWETFLFRLRLPPAASASDS